MTSPHLGRIKASTLHQLAMNGALPMRERLILAMRALALYAIELERLDPSDPLVLDTGDVLS